METLKQAGGMLNGELACRSEHSRDRQTNMESQADGQEVTHRNRVI